MNRLALDGGSLSPRRGRNPRGEKNVEMNPASSSIPSDWYDEKSCSAAMHDKKSSVDSATLALGQTFATRRSDERMPANTTTISAASLALVHRSVGTYQNRWSPTPA